MQGAVEWPQLTAIIGMIVSSGVVVAGVVLWLWSKMASVDTEHRKAIDEMRAALNNLRVEVAEKYVPNVELGKFEKRIENSLNNLTQQFEKGFDRVMNLLTGQVTRVAWWARRGPAAYALPGTAAAFTSSLPR
jgi:hypothetical protein